MLFRAAGSSDVIIRERQEPSTLALIVAIKQPSLTHTIS